MKRKSVHWVRWSAALKTLFSPVRKKRFETRLNMEELHARIVPATYHPSALVADGAVNSLRADIVAANNDTTTSPTETFDLTSGATYTLTIKNPVTGSENLGYAGDLDLNNLHGHGIKTYIFIGQGAGATIQQKVLDRVFNIIGTNVKAEFENVTITGGIAEENGSVGSLLGANNAWGGGILNQGAQLILSNTHIENNIAEAAFGGNAPNAQNANKKGEIAFSGPAGQSGLSAFGGGLYSSAGTVTIENNSNITNNEALGGHGGNGGNGGAVSGTASGDAGGGGSGGTGGNAAGGGVYIAGGTLILNSDVQVSTNIASAGYGGKGGAGGAAKIQDAAAGIGGLGGVGGEALGGGIAVGSGNVTISANSIVEKNVLIGASGGSAGVGGAGTKTLDHSGTGGLGGAGGSAIGGGISVISGNVVITTDSTVKSNHAGAGIGGHGGNGGNEKGKTGVAGPGGAGGVGGSATGGGVYVKAGTVTVSKGSSVNLNLDVAAIGGIGGTAGAGSGTGVLIRSGGDGGDAGIAEGGGIYAGTGSVLIETTASVNSNFARGRGPSAGGTATAPTGAAGGVGGAATFKGLEAGTGGIGGAGFSAYGGGIYAIKGNVSIETKSEVFNDEVAGYKGGAGGEGGNGGNADFPGDGGLGGAGGVAEGGGIYAVDGAVSVADSIVNLNHVFGGVGGQGGIGGFGPSGIRAAGGNGGVGGDAAGGGIWSLSGGVSIPASSSVDFNIVVGGTGGHGGTGAPGGSGGVGGFGEGGGIWSQTGGVIVSGGVTSNALLGGAGGTGGTGHHGGGGGGGLAGVGQGGGIYAGSGTVSILNHAKIIANVASGGTGGRGNDAFTAFSAGGNGGSAAVGQGGGVYAASGSVAVSSALVSKNVAAGNSGGVAGAGPIGGTGGNAAAAQGGGIYIGTGSLSLTNVSINDNKADGLLGGGAGGGVYGTSLSNPTMPGIPGEPGGQGGNGGNAEGGGLYLSTGALKLTIAESSVTSNSAGHGGDGGTGGGRTDQASNQTTATKTGHAGNSGNSLGGGIYIAAGTTTISDTTVGLNIANLGGDLATSFTSVPGVSNGGGIYIDPKSGTTTIDNSTIGRNTSDNEGGGIYNAGNLSMTSTLVGENVSTTTNDTDLFDLTNPTTLTDSLIQNPTGNSVASQSENFFGETNTKGTNNVNLSTTLSTAPNGTKYFTFTGPSDALKNGSNPDGLLFDQIGDSRSINGSSVDIGAIQTNESVTSVPFIVAAGKNGYVEVIEIAGTTRTVVQNFQPFPGYTGLVSVALGDVNSDGIQDIIVAANGSVKIYDGASAITTGVSFANSASWSRLPNNLKTPVIMQFTPFAGYTGPLNVAAGDLQNNGVNEVIVAMGAATGSTGRVGVFNGLTGKEIGSSFTPFLGSSNGVVVAAGDVLGNGSAELVVGTQTKGDQVKVYTFNGSMFTQDNSTISPFGTVTSSTAQLTIAVLNANGSGTDDIAIGLLNNGVGTVEVVTGSGTKVSTFNLGGGLTQIAISAYNSLDIGPDSLLIGTVPSGTAQFHIINPLTGAQTSSFNELLALTGGISLAGT